MCATPSPAEVTFFEVSAGERTVPGVWHENYWLRRHEVVYDHVASLVQPDDVVLDAGCGEGYGAAALVREGARVLALDYDRATTQHVALRYPHLPAACGNLVALPLRRDAVDLLVSLQTVEHLWDQEAFVSECARVLRPGGRVVLSTPNRHTFPPGNIYHHRELDADELAALLRASFDDVAVSGVFHGDRLSQWQKQHGSIVDAQIAARPESWSPDLVTAVRGVRAHDFTISRETHGCLDLIAVGRAR